MQIFSVGVTIALGSICPKFTSIFSHFLLQSTLLALSLLVVPVIQHMDKALFFVLDNGFCDCRPFQSLRFNKGHVFYKGIVFYQIFSTSGTLKENSITMASSQSVLMDRLCN